jgi:hypothetical protein
MRCGAWVGGEYRTVIRELLAGSRYFIAIAVLGSFLAAIVVVIVALGGFLLVGGRKRHGKGASATEDAPG